MRIDRRRIKRYLYDILSNTREIETLLKEHGEGEILNNRHLLKSLKYSLVEISEAISLVLQHIIAKQYGIPVKGYIETVKKASEKGIISQDLSTALKPFFDFRNALVHRYWTIDDAKLLQNCKARYRDFFDFIKTIEDFLERGGD